jgi:hypothetical protein
LHVLPRVLGQLPEITKNQVVEIAQERGIGKAQKVLEACLLCGFALNEFVVSPCPKKLVCQPNNSLKIQ